MKISVVTVCYNAERFIAETIESVLAQSWTDLEYIIVDGGSSDETLAIISSYSGDTRLKWISEPDNGIADAMNKGVALATGDIVAHLNADDYYSHDEVLECVAKHFLNKPETVWLTGGFDFVTEAGRYIRSVRVRRYSFRRLVRGNIILHPSTFIRRDTMVEVGGFDQSLLYCMDYDLFLRLAAIAPPLLIDKQFSCFRVHENSRTITDSERSYAEEFAVRCSYLESKRRNAFFYKIDYRLKRVLNRWLYNSLFSENKDRSF